MRERSAAHAGDADAPGRYHFDQRQLAALAGERREAYQVARPFPHVVIDGIVPDAVLDEIVAEFPSSTDDRWLRFESERERKLASTHATPMGDVTAHLLAEFNGAVFVDFLQALTGMSGLVVDPHLHGGGLHQIEPGGLLDVHADFNLHPGTGLERRLNLLLYLNRDWRDDWGGALELWDRDMTGAQVSIAPVFNRCVIFTTSDHSFHGHPQPLACPPGVTRKSLALYYYSLPQHRSVTGHNTVWRTPGVDLQPQGPAGRWLREVVPPAAVKAVGRARKAWRSRRDSSGSQDEWIRRG